MATDESAGPSTATVEDIIKALLDPRVLDALGNALHSKIVTVVDEIVEKKLTPLSNAVNALEADVIRLRADNNSLRRHVEELDTYGRGCNLIIHGLRETSYSDAASASVIGGARDDSRKTGSGLGLSAGPTETNVSTEQAVVEFCSDVLNVDVTRADISVAHRLKKSKFAKPDEPAPIIVRFSSRRTRNNVYAARKCLKNHEPRIFINEHLIKERSDLLRQARLLVKNKQLQGAWTSNGIVYIRVSDLPGTHPKRIDSVSDLPINLSRT